VRTFAIRGRHDVVVAANQAQKWARELGFSERRAGEVAIVVSELASNVHKHGVRGELRLEETPAELTVAAYDEGPPIRDLELALTDGYDDRGPIDPAAFLGRGGLGTGLGAVVRLADRLEYREEATGKTVTAKFLR
jgi:anti-sigma regulatory factor (Ser/Thr protein kinase)